MKVLQDILHKVAIESIQGATTVTINKIDFDSRNIGANDVFVAIKGTISDGHDFISTADFARCSSYYL